MLRPFVVDTERNLVEKGDLLGTICYADQLADTIKNVQAEQAYTIGLYGTWGSGKSTIIRTAKEKLETDENNRIKMVVYDSWKYSGDSFRRMFLLHLQSELGLKPTPEMERFYEATTEEIEPKVTLKRRGVIFAIIVLIVGFAVTYGLWKANCFATPIPAMAIVSLCALVLSMLGGVYYELKVTQNKNILFAPEQFEDCFRQMMERVLKKKGWYSRRYYNIKDFINFDTQKTKDLDKLVIVIDNLDRCESGVVYSMLTDIKTFLGAEKYDVVFVIPVDYEALKKHLFAKNVDNTDADEFLRKFFNVVIKMKEHRGYELMHYITELNRDQQLHFQPNTLSLIAKEYTKNPRRILQTLNNLTVEQSLYKENYAKEHETLIAACMILRDHYPSMAEAILSNDTILFEDSCYEKTKSSSMPADLKENDNLYAFMRMAKNTLQSAKTEDLRQILTNTDMALTHLSDELRQALNSFDSSTIIKQLQQYPEKEADIFIEIQRLIHLEEMHDADDAMVSWAECVAKINIEHPLSEYWLHMMDNALDYVYDFVPRTVTATSAICKYAKSLDDAGYPTLKEKLFSFVQDAENKQYTPYQDYVRSVFETFTRKEDCGSLREFAEKYMYETGDVTKLAFTDEQRQYLLTGTYVEQIIKDLKSEKDERCQKLLIWCFENLISLPKSVFENLFAKVMRLIGDRNGKTVDQFANHLAYMLPILKSMPECGDVKESGNYFKFIFDSRITRPGYSKSIMDEANESNAQVLAEFCLEMYRISERKLTINPMLLKIQKHCEIYVKQQLMGMLENGIDLVPFRNNILELTEIDDAWYALIPHAFKKNTKGTRADANLLKNKLQLLYTNRGEQKALNLLVELTQDDEICTMFMSVLDLHNYEELNSLPEVLLPRIVSQYTIETADQFKDNNAMLKLVLLKGARSTEDTVTQSLISRLNGNRDVEGAVDVIKSHNGWKRTNKSALKGLLLQKMPEDYDLNSEAIELTELQEEIKSILEKW